MSAALISAVVDRRYKPGAVVATACRAVALAKAGVGRNQRTVGEAVGFPRDDNVVPYKIAAEDSGHYMVTGWPADAGGFGARREAPQLNRA